MKKSFLKSKVWYRLGFWERNYCAEGRSERK